MKKLLLHVCCAPCSTSVLERLVSENEYHITLFFSNSNILPIEEYNKRKDALIKFIQMVHPTIKIIFDDYNKQEFLESIKGRENLGEGSIRCDACIYYRLYKTAQMAKKIGYDAFTTTLTVSPHKNATKINEMGSTISKEMGVIFLERDFKKKNGFLRSIELCKEYNIYRQTYCGCNNLISNVGDKINGI